MKYRIFIDFTSSYYVGEIEADSKEDAEIRGEEMDYNIPELPVGCSAPYITGINAEVKP